MAIELNLFLLYLLHAELIWTSSVEQLEILVHFLMKLDCLLHLALKLLLQFAFIVVLVLDLSQKLIADHQQLAFKHFLALQLLRYLI